MFFLLLGLVLLCYVFYYRRFVVGAPVLYCQEEQRTTLEEYCPILFEPYYPTMWAPQAHIQSIARAIVQTFPNPQRKREMVTLSDGGHVCLDWYNDKETPPMLCDEKNRRPIVIVLPGLAGSSDENYVRHWIDDISEQAYRCVVYNYRGCGKSKLSNTKLYSGANIEDLVEVLEHIHSKYPEAPLVAVGVSLGSTQLVRYVCECSRNGKVCRLKAAMLVSSLWDMPESQVNLNKPVNKHSFNRYLTFKYTGIMKENKDMFLAAEEAGSLGFDFKYAVKSSYLHDIAERVVVPMFGYEDVDSYLEDWSPCHYLDGINIPFLVVNSLDDPFCPLHSLPLEETQKNSNLIIATTRTGGHIGFMEGFFPFRKTWIDRLLVQFVAMVFEHDAL